MHKQSVFALSFLRVKFFNMPDISVALESLWERVMAKVKGRHLAVYGR